MENLNEDFKVLNELLRTAYKLISPISYHDDIRRLTPEFMKRDAVKSPGCYLAVGDGNSNTIFPICNRYGYKDPNIIRFSLKVAKRLADKQNSDQVDIPGAIVKLQRMLNKYDKPIPNTVSQAVLKAKATRSFNQKTFEDNRDLITDVQEGVVDGVMAISILYQSIRPLFDLLKTEEDPQKRQVIKQKIQAKKQKIEKIKAQQA